ncbi:calnexin-like isoform X2 [Oratosquilla oratoria]|uniref:calnexin-like isoform X2 n=1 Tax=Oratosquilla oratoria TaxID=337810 RepID=UPI003F7670E3
MNVSAGKLRRKVDKATFLGSADRAKYCVNNPSPSKQKVKMEWRWLLLGLLLASFSLSRASEDESEATVETEEEVVAEEEEEEDIPYATPKAPDGAYFAETFDDLTAVEAAWIKSEAKKDDVDEIIAKYDGVWSVEPVERDALAGDRGLVLKSKAKHAAISAMLKKPFHFINKPLVVQYEVNLQNGQDCGGAYIKLLSVEEGKAVDLNGFHDKTPYTIMFGPDKCGTDHKLHFIFRHVNPITGEREEKHAKRPRDKIEEPFKDKKPHLYTLVVRPDNSYEISLDHKVINSGNLLEDFTPAVNPPKEIDDPNDFMPDDWDEREKIPDPDATKPDDWDEDAPMQIVDTTAVKPDGWLNDEPEMIPDPVAEKPEDWDDDMDGEWEAPLINNPRCDDAPGCGEWKAPTIDNPEYKGKWKPPMIDNPNYRGKWKPHKIDNPDYFEDLEPFKMTPIAAVGIELWSMSDNILFDNILITDNVAEAYQFAQETFNLKIDKLEKGQAGVMRRILNYSNKHPWLYAVYVVVIALPVVLIFVFCCTQDTKEEKAAALRKKTDEPTEDDPQDDNEADGEVAAEGGEEGDAEEEAEGEGIGDSEEKAESNEEGQEEEEDQTQDEEKDEAMEDSADTRKSPRLRKARKE